MRFKGIISQVISFDDRNDYFYGFNRYEFDEDNPVDIINVVPFPAFKFEKANSIFRMFTGIGKSKPYTHLNFGLDDVITLLQEPGHHFSEGDIVELDISIYKV